MRRRAFSQQPAFGYDLHCDGNSASNRLRDMAATIRVTALKWALQALDHSWNFDFALDYIGESFPSAAGLSCPESLKGYPGVLPPRRDALVNLVTLQ